MMRNPMKKFFVLCLLLVTACASPDRAPMAEHTPDARQQIFATPGQAVDALVSATRDDRQADLLTILGPRAGKLVYSGDKVDDQNSREKFLSAYDNSHEI